MKHEIEVATFEDGCYTKREFGFVPSEKANEFFQKAVSKYRQMDGEFLITHRLMDDQENYTLVNVFHNDTKRPVRGKSKVR